MPTTEPAADEPVDADDADEPQDAADTADPEASDDAPPSSAASSAQLLATHASSTAAATRATALDGLHLRSIEVDGNENLLTYDSSNLFFHRIGNLNGNTGHTDPSGLNVVAATRSTVRSGNSTAPRPAPAPSSSPAFGLPPLPTNGASAAVTDGTSFATATGDDTLVIGGDGVQDGRVRVHGDRNAVTYHDGNAAIGGSGDVNSQIGDSAHGGTVAMDVVDSVITAGDALGGSVSAAVSP
jgi:hypothetical protein